MQDQHHLFVDNVRFWSMFAVVAIHSTGVFNTIGVRSPLLIQASLTPVKFGTIAFFLISGFLLGERIESCKPIEYLGRRLRRIFLPWMFWVSLMTAFLLAADALHHRIAVRFAMEEVPIVWGKLFSCIATTAFWFVPNLLLSLCILLLLRRYLRDVRLGVVLFGINLFYVVNIYMRWLPSLHTEALFGFVFYLWLGAYASWNFGVLIRWLARVRMNALVGLAVSTGLLAFGEARILDHLGSPDPNNTLRLSNQIFSIAVVLLILKLRHATWPRFVDVRNHTFGIYLSHSMILAIMLGVLRRSLALITPGHLLNSSLEGLALWVVTTAVTYSISLSVTKVIAGRPTLRWMVGAGPAVPSKAKQIISPQLAPSLEGQAY